MTTTESTPVHGISTNLTYTNLSQQLTQLEEQLNHLFACYQFYDQAILAMADPEHGEQCDLQNSFLGLFLTQRWLSEQRQHAINDLQQIKRGLANHD